MNKLFNLITKKIFYSRLLKKVKMEYYKEAYNQGKFDQKMNDMYPMEKFIQMEEYFNENQYERDL